MKRKKPKPVPAVHRAKKLALHTRQILNSILGEESYHYSPEKGDLHKRQSIDMLLSFGIIRFVRKKKYKFGWRGRGLWWDAPQTFKLGDY